VKQLKEFEDLRRKHQKTLLKLTPITKRTNKKLGCLIKWPIYKETAYNIGSQ